MTGLAIRGFGEMEIGGQLRPFHLGTFQARVFCERRAVELHEYQVAVAKLSGTGGLADAVLLGDLLYSALMAGAKLNKLPVDFDADEVSFWMDAADAEEIKKLFTVAASLATAEPDAPGKPPGPKAAK